MDIYRYVKEVTMVTGVTVMMYFPAYALASEIASIRFDSTKSISVIACKVGRGNQLAEFGKRISEVDSNAIFTAVLDVGKVSPVTHWNGLPEGPSISIGAVLAVN
jgi:hypothetical protein